MKFDELVQDNDLLKAIHQDFGFTEATDIQRETIPLILSKKDLVAQAKTGSGKTFAFGIPILERLHKNNVLQALIIVPTRELCEQITTELKKLAKHKKVHITAIYGGVAINPQIHALQKAQIVVGTPGRLLDHAQRGTINTRTTEVLVLDEADRMLDMGFIEDIEKIIQSTPSDTQLLLFSATMPAPIRQLANEYLNDPLEIKTSSHVQEELLPQFYYQVDHRKKFSLFYHILQEENPKKAIVFCRTQRTVDAVSRNLSRHGMNADCLHGGLSQSRRNKIMEDFRKGKIHVLVATDIAARGLDVQDVSHVINYDVPQNPQDYTHRIGRTARAGQSGKAITLLEERDYQAFDQVLRHVPQEPTKLVTPEFEKKWFQRDDSQGDNRGHRGGPQGGSRGGFRGRSSRGGSSGESNPRGRSRGPPRRKKTRAR